VHGGVYSLQRRRTTVDDGACNKGSCSLSLNSSEVEGGIKHFETLSKKALEAVLLRGDDNDTETGLGHDVKDGVEDGLSVGGEGASAFSEDPDDGVHGPGKNGKAHDAVVGTEEEKRGTEGTSQVAIQCLCECNLSVNDSTSTVEYTVVDHGVFEVAEVVDDGEEAEYGEGKENPAIATANGGADETGSDHKDVVEEEVVPDVVSHVTEVGEGVKHHRGSDDPVEVASVVEFTAVEAANVEAVVSGHGEVGKGCNEGHETAHESRRGKELEDCQATAGADAPVFNAIGHVGAVVVPEVTVDEVNRVKEKDDEANPKGDAASVADAVVAGVNGVAGSYDVFLKAAIA